MADKEIPSVVQDSFENNKWMNAGGFEIPINIEPPIEFLQGVLEAINRLLDFSLFVLDFIKAFVRNFLNPLLSIVKKIIAFLKSILIDLRQVGFYFTSDVPLWEDASQLKGGYPAFERRMLARLTNDADPNRPNFSSQSAVFGLYLYADSNLGDFSESLKLLLEMLKLFGRGVKPPPPPLPTNISVQNVKVREGLFSDASEDALEIKWQVSGGNNGNEVGGFFIEVSTEIDGFYLAYDSIVSNATFSTDKGGKRQRGLVSDERYKSNVRIFGGSVWLQALTELFYEEGNQKPFELKLVKNPNSNTTISPSKLEGGKTQRTYFVPIFDFSMDNSKEYSVKIKYADLPEGYDIETESSAPREKVAIRITTVNIATRELIIKNTSGITRDFIGEPKYYFNNLNLYYTVDPFESVKTGVTATPHYADPSNEMVMSPPSDPIVVNVSAIQEDFRQICFWAVASAILRGYDITKSNKGIASLMPTVNMNVMRSQSSEAYKRASVIGATFGERLVRDIDAALDRAFDRVRCSETLQATILEAYEGLGSNGVEEYLGEDGYLRGEKVKRVFGNVEQMMKGLFKSKKMTLIQEGRIEDVLEGIGIPKAMETPCYYDRAEETLTRTMLVHQETTLMRGLKSFAVYGDEVVDDGGLVITTSQKFPVEEEAFILTILNLLFGSQELGMASDWSCFRLFPEGFPAVENIINGIINFMENVQETLEGFGKKILKAIAAIEEKINRIQQIIALIDRLLELLKGLSLDITYPLYALAHVAEGTDGLVAKLMSSQLKPPYNPPDVTDDEELPFGLDDTYAGGVLLVAGGLGTVELFEFLIKLLVSPEEQTTDTIIIDGEEE